MAEAKRPNDARQAFDAVVAQNLRGLYRAQRDALMAVARDPRCTQRHARVLTEIIAHMGNETGLAYPGRAALIRATGVWPGELQDPAGGYSDGVVRNTISDLLRFGYLASIQRGPEGGGRAIAHYTVAKPSVDQLQAQITKWVDDERKRGRLDALLRSRVTHAGDTRNGVGVTGTHDTRNSGVTGVNGTVTRRERTRRNTPELALGFEPTGDAGVTANGAHRANGGPKTSSVSPAGRKRGAAPAGPTAAEIEAGFKAWTLARLRRSLPGRPMPPSCWASTRTGSMPRSRSSWPR